ncbi:MAG: 3'(2'),5'-bisphosphate nucleotidase CysQ [Pseudomonadota bacterium]
MQLDDRDAVASLFAFIASQAAIAVMDVYATEFETRFKDDKSPVSDADEHAEEIILEHLAKHLPGVPVLAEEAAARHGVAAQLGDTFILVDPVDGTKEFLKRTGEFTVNIALIENTRPVAGCVYAPAAEKLYYGGTHGVLARGFKPGEDPAAGRSEALRTRDYPKHGLVAVTSSSHLDDKTTAFLETLPISSRASAGSSLKFCLVAEGDADVYPRFGPTMEWDTAAGHAVLNAAGGQVLDPTGAAFSYNKHGAGFKNGAFIAWGGGRWRDA